MIKLQDHSQATQQQQLLLEDPDVNFEPYVPLRDASIVQNGVFPGLGGAIGSGGGGAMSYWNEEAALLNESSSVPPGGNIINQDLNFQKNSVKSQSTRNPKSDYSTADNNRPSM
jgi:hypothetical protein